MAFIMTSSVAGPIPKVDRLYVGSGCGSRPMGFHKCHDIRVCPLEFLPLTFPHDDQCHVALLTEEGVVYSSVISQLLPAKGPLVLDGPHTTLSGRGVLHTLVPVIQAPMKLVSSHSLMVIAIDREISCPQSYFLSVTGMLDVMSWLMSNEFQPFQWGQALAGALVHLLYRGEIWAFPDHARAQGHHLCHTVRIEHITITPNYRATHRSCVETILVWTNAGISSLYEPPGENNGWAPYHVFPDEVVYIRHIITQHGKYPFQPCRWAAGFPEFLGEGLRPCCCDTPAGPGVRSSHAASRRDGGCCSFLTPYSVRLHLLQGYYTPSVRKRMSCTMAFLPDRRPGVRWRLRMGRRTSPITMPS